MMVSRDYIISIYVFTDALETIWNIARCKMTNHLQRCFERTYVPMIKQCTYIGKYAASIQLCLSLISWYRVDTILVVTIMRVIMRYTVHSFFFENEKKRKKWNLYLNIVFIIVTYIYTIEIFMRLCINEVNEFWRKDLFYQYIIILLKIFKDKVK